jgi:hypothetical protein
VTVDKRILFTLGAFVTWAPDLHRYYAETIEALLSHDPSLKLNFRKSVFACASVNLGPRTVCFRHVDSANLPNGWCAITALGNFDHRKGGHLILWELGLIIEFPPGATILIPSACVSHSNISIGKDETRYSFTQYTAGSIFRWVEHRFMNEEMFWASLNEDELVVERDKQSTRLEMGLERFQKLEH